MSVSTKAALLSLALASFLPTATAQWHFNYGSDKVRGVNLGGWLVLEPWITPSLFEKTGNNDIVDEWTFGEYQDYDTARSVLEDHWNSFITEEDFAQIAAAGLNHVRLPIGYWAFETADGEPYIDGQLPYLKKAVGWAANHGLKVIVDLHGAPGSQNGFDNSGHRIDFPLWQTKDGNVKRTNEVLKTIASMFSDNAETVSVIAPLNEPAGYRGQQVLDVARQYWLDSYGNIRERSPETVELIHDAFQDLNYWSDFMTGSNFKGVAIDTHIYQMFSDAGNAMSYEDMYANMCNRGSTLSNFHMWVIVGEWTATGNDCAKYLNGRGVGARYDGSYPGSPRVGSCKGLTGHASSFSEEYKTHLGKFWEAQIVTYEKADGWVQWTWKAEEADEWTYKAGLKYGWIPQDPTKLVHNMCSDYKVSAQADAVVQ